MTKDEPKKSYAELLEELKLILDWFQNTEVSVDKAAEKYESGIALVTELEQRLTAAEGEIDQLARDAA